MYIHAAPNHDWRAEAGQAHGEGRHDPHQPDQHALGLGRADGGVSEWAVYDDYRCMYIRCHMRVY